jgi:serine/threonine protein kinase
LNSILIFLKGGNLGDCIRNKIKTERKFDDEQIFKWIKELINGLYYLRKKNVIHRDIKPEYL